MTTTVDEQSSDAPAALRLDGVTAGYQDSIVLRDVDLEVRRGSVVALLGPNGAGKTTLLRYASGLVSGRAGRLEVGGGNVTGQSAHQIARHGVCHIPEGRGIFPSLTVRENMTLLSPRLSAGELIETALTAFPVLSRKLSQVAGTLSGGEQQMLALSRAYAGTPTVILLDELSMGLAPKIIDEIFLSIEQLRRRNVSLLLVEQYVDRALNVADYVYVLSNGSIGARGPAAEFSRRRIAESYLGAGAEPGGHSR